MTSSDHKHDDAGEASEILAKGAPPRSTPMASDTLPAPPPSFADPGGAATGVLPPAPLLGVSLADGGRPLPRDTVKMTAVRASSGSHKDTVRDTEAPADVKALFARVGAGESVDRTALVDQLEKMLGVVRSTAASFEEIVVLVQRKTALAPSAVLQTANVRAIHPLPDGAALVHTTWTVAERDELFRVLERERPAWLADHDDERGVPMLRSALLDVARAATSYADVLYLLGDDVTFRSPDPTHAVAVAGETGET